MADDGFGGDEDPWLKNREAEIKSLDDLAGDKNQRGTPIPALFSLFYKFVQNPSTVSIETYKRMVDTDDTIGSGLDFLTSALAARLGTYQHPSAEITKFVWERALQRIEGGWPNAVKEILSATGAGFSVSEKVWANDDDGFVPRKIVTLPPSSILFEVDRNGSLTPDGVSQYQRNYPYASSTLGTLGGFGFATTGGGFVSRPDPYAKFGDLPYPLRSPAMLNYLAIKIPKMKCIHYAFGGSGRFGNPYGRSLLRRCYKWWVIKDAIMKMMTVALDRKGTPLTIVFADPNATLEDPNASANYGIENQRGETPGVRADLAAKQAFENVHNDSTIVLPGKKGQIFEVDTLDVESNAEVFISAINLCNSSMLRGMLIPALIFMNGDGTGSYALGQEHAKTFEKILDSWLQSLEAVLLEHLVGEIIAYNFPESAWKKDGLGSFGKRQLSQDERQKEIEAFEKLQAIGAIDMNELTDLNKVREASGFEPRETPIEHEDPEVDGDNEDKGGEDAATGE